MLRRPIDEPRLLALVLQVLRRQADRRERVDLGVVADLGPAVDDRRRADAAVRGRCAHAGRCMACGPIVVPRADLRAPDGRSPIGGSGSGRRRARAADRLPRPPDRRRYAAACARASDVRRASERDLEAQPIARHDLPPELGVVDAAQVDARVRRRRFALQQQHRRDLRQRFEHQDARASAARPGKWPWKNSSLTVTFLTATSRRPGVVLGDRVHEQGRMPVAEAVEEDRDVEHGQGNAELANC